MNGCKGLINSLLHSIHGGSDEPVRTHTSLSIVESTYAQHMCMPCGGGGDSLFRGEALNKAWSIDIPPR